MKAMRAHQPGGPEQLRYEDAPDPELGEAAQALHDLLASKVFGKLVLTP